MAHGAPDHVRMQDVNVLSYVDKTINYIDKIILPWTAFIPIDVTGVGTFGSLVFGVDYKNTVIRISVEGVAWLYLRLNYLWDNLNLGGIAPYRNYGLTRYDIANDNFGIWIDFDWQLAFTKALKIEIINNSGANITCKTIIGFWKEKV